MTRRVIVAAVLGGIVLFVWQAAAWMVMPWSDAAVAQFQDESAVQNVVLANTPTSGTYMLPYTEEAAAEGGPVVFAAVRHEGHSMGVAMGGQFVVNILALLIAAVLLANVRHLSYGRRVLFVAAIGLISWMSVSLSHALWWGFGSAFVGAELLNMLIGWALAGLVLAWQVRPAVEPGAPAARPVAAEIA